MGDSLKTGAYPWVIGNAFLIYQGNRNPRCLPPGFGETEYPLALRQHIFFSVSMTVSRNSFVITCRSIEVNSFLRFDVADASRRAAEDIEREAICPPSGRLPSEAGALTELNDDPSFFSILRQFVTHVSRSTPPDVRRWLDFSPMTRNAPIRSRFAG
jgi:hypothetical protein